MHRALCFLLLASCAGPSGGPFVGDCADYPEGAYDFGQIGIGTCISGPTLLRWIDDPSQPDHHLLAVVNANPFLDFDSSSLLVIDPDGIPLDGGTVPVTSVDAAALPVDDYASGLAWVPERSLALVPTRYSGEGRRQEAADELYFADLSEPMAPAQAGVAQDGDWHMTLHADPGPSAYDPETGRAYVVNTSSGSLSVLDVYSTPVEEVDAVPRARTSAGRFLDNDRSGSRVEVAQLGVLSPHALVEDDWTFSFSEGSFRAWLPSADGVFRIDSTGAATWSASGQGVELAPDDAGDDPVDPQYWSSSAGIRLLYAGASSGAIQAATLEGSLGDWTVEDSPLLQPRQSRWDTALGGPMAVSDGSVDYLFYDGLSSDGTTSIGLATATDAASFQRENGGEPVIAAGAVAHGSVAVADPFVVWDGQGDRWRMYFGAFDGQRWSIGHASSTDLVDWDLDPDPVLAPEGADAASPAVGYGDGRYRMLYARREGGAWSVAEAVSVDGSRWEETGEVWPLDDGGDAPPGPGLQAEPTGEWSIRGEQTGPVSESYQAGALLQASSLGWELRLSAGSWISAEQAGDPGVNGVVAGSRLPDLDLVYLAMTDADGRQSIGAALWNDGAPEVLDAPLLQGQRGSFDADGVFSPVVFALPDGGYGMLYAGASGGVTRTGLATSADGLDWSTGHEPVLDAGGADWSSIAVIPGSVEDTGEGLVLWYTGSDGSHDRIGAASSADGLAWEPLPSPAQSWWLDEGSPGQFDDSGVADPFVLLDSQEGVEHMWYSGLDGSTWRVGYASRAIGDDTWVRATDATTGEPRPVIEGRDGFFDMAHAFRPVVTMDQDGGWTVLYSGQDSVVSRVGVAEGLSPSLLYRHPRAPTTGDEVRFSTFRGDAGHRTTVDLAQTVDSFDTSGSGIGNALLDPRRGWLYLASPSSAYLYVVDVRDDGTPSWSDNLYGIEHVLVVRTTAGAVGFRGLALGPQGRYLYATNDAPESVMVFDLDQLDEVNRGQQHMDAAVGWLAADRGSESDRGWDTYASVGPDQLVVDGDMLYVSNFNANSIGVYDLRLGAWGMQVDELPLVGENPHDLALSPDGSLMAVAMYVGDVSDGHAESEIALVDTDPSSPTWLQVLARVVNR